MRKRLIRYSDTEDKVVIPSRLYSGLVRSLAWKIEYWDRITRAVDYLAERDKIDNFLDPDDMKDLAYMLLGWDQIKFKGDN